MAQISQNQTFDGLGTLALFTAPQAGDYFVDGKISLPSIVGGAGPSSLLVVINQNGSPVYTGPVGATGFYTGLVCALNDAITVVFSSSAAADQGLNVIKSTIAWGSTF